MNTEFKDKFERNLNKSFNFNDIKDKNHKTKTFNFNYDGISGTGFIELRNNIEIKQPEFILSFTKKGSQPF